MKPLALWMILILFPGCATQRKTHYTSYPPAHQLDIPYSDVFRGDRSPSDGFSDPVVATRVFLTRVFRAAHDEPLLRDDGFCRRFLSARLRQRVATSRAQFDHRTVDRVPRPEDAHPGERGTKGTILSAWDLPTSFRLGGRHATRRSYTVADEHYTDVTAIVDAIFIWGSGTQYEGDERLTSVVLVREGDRWFIDDLYTHNGIYCSPGNLSDSLVR